MRPTIEFHNDGTMTVDRTGPIDLSHFFMDAFDEYRHWIAYNSVRMDGSMANPGLLEKEKIRIKEKYTQEKKIASFEFHTDSLLSMMLYKNKPQDFKIFLEENVDANKKENKNMLELLEHTAKERQRVSFEYFNDNIFLYPLDTLKIQDIEEIVRPSKTMTPAVQEKYDKFQRKGKIVTQPYIRKDEKRLEEALARVYPILRVYDLKLPELNYFAILQRYNLPTTKLKVVELE